MPAAGVGGRAAVLVLTVRVGGSGAKGKQLSPPRNTWTGSSRTM